MLTERLVLRRFTEDDIEAFATYRSDPRVARYQGWSAPVSLVAAAELVRELAAGDPQQPGWFQYAIELRATRTLIGDIGVNLAENRIQAEIGFTIAIAYQGQGYAAEAIRRVLEHLFGDRGLYRVSADCDARNLPSARLLTRLGFRQEGHHLGHVWLKGEWTDDLLFGVLATDWSTPYITDAS